MKTLNPEKNIIKKRNDNREDFELPKEIDFSGSVRGRFYRPKKISTTIRIDDDIILFFRRLASENKSPYQTLVNEVLRDYKSRFESTKQDPRLTCEKKA